MGVVRYRRVTLLVSSLILVLLLLGLATVLAAGLMTLNTAMGQEILAWRSRPGPAATATAYPMGWWQRYANTADGYSLALPPDWKVVPLNGQGSQDAQGTDDSQAQVAQRLANEARQSLGAGSGLWAAIGPESDGRGVTTINIIRQPLGEDTSVEGFAQANLASLEQQSNRPTLLGQAWLRLSIGRVLRVEMSYNLPDSGGKTLHVTQFYLASGKNGYVVTCVTRPEQAKQYDPIFEGVVRSLRWTA